MFNHIANFSHPTNVYFQILWCSKNINFDINQVRISIRRSWKKKISFSLTLFIQDFSQNRFNFYLGLLYCNSFSNTLCGLCKLTPAFATLCGIYLFILWRVRCDNRKSLRKCGRNFLFYKNLFPKLIIILGYEIIINNFRSNLLLGRINFENQPKKIIYNFPNDIFRLLFL